MSILYLVATSALATLATVYDTVMSVKGIKAGVAVEANLTWLYGTDKPTALQYYLVNTPIVLLASVVSIIGYCIQNPALYYAGLTGPIVLGAKHIQGGIEWRALGIRL